jgi:DNA repair protein RadD
MIQLHKDQLEVLPKLRSALKTHQSVILRAPCRFGKTVVAAYMADGIIKSGQRVVFGVHRRELARQASNTFKQFGIPHTFLMGGMDYDPHAPAVIATADSLALHPEAVKGQWFIPDEAHLWAKGSRAATIDAFRERGARCILLTATPALSNGHSLRRIADVIVHGPKERDLIAAGRLAQYLPIAPVRPDLSQVPLSGSEFNKRAVDALMGGSAVVKEAARYWKQFAPDKRTLSFAPSRKRGREYALDFNAAGIPSEFIDGETPDDQRINIINAFADGRLINLFNCQLAQEGWDLSSQVGRNVPIQAVGLYSPTRSLPKAIQMMMRPMTSQDGTAIILDHAGIMVNHDGTLNHGFPDDDREWSLDGSVAFKKSERLIPTCTCGNCFAVFRYQSKCPYCNYERDIEGRSLEEVALEMEAIDPEKIRAEQERQRKQERQKEGMAKSLTDLAKLAKTRGYKAGWVAARLKSRGVKFNYEDIMRAMR